MGERPTYRRIADDYQSKIASGEISDGARLPSERELCDIHDVSTITARAAVNELKRRGLAYGVRGKGTFVRVHSVVTRVAPQRYWRGEQVRTYVREAEKAGVPMEVAHETAETKATADVAGRLGIAPGDPVMATKYLIHMDGRPVTSSTSWEPLGITRGTEIEHPHEGPHADSGIVTRFDAIGQKVKRVEEALTIRLPDTAECQRLDLPRDVPVVIIDQAFRAGLDEDVVVEAAEIIYPSDRYRFIYDMEVR